MSEHLDGDALDRIRPILRTRQVREFTQDPPGRDEVDAIADAARWSGSSSNSQPWRFVVIRDVSTLRTLGDIGLPSTRPLQTAAAAIAVVLPDVAGRAVSFAFDEGRAVERMLVAATMLGLSAGMCWMPPDSRARAGEVLGVPSDHSVRSIVAIGHPTDEARKPKAAAGSARLPRDEVVFEERWPAG